MANLRRCGGEGGDFVKDGGAVEADLSQFVSFVFEWMIAGNFKAPVVIGKLNSHWEFL